MSMLVAMIAQAVAVTLLGMVCGSMFGIWLGYPILGYSPSTFVEVHQTAVRGLNTVLPAMAAFALVLVAGLAFAARHRPSLMWSYVIVALLVVSGGLITRYINQPINTQVMTWTVASLPSDWGNIRHRWWTWHQIRLSITFIAVLLLIVVVLLDRRTLS